ncbi:MAG: glycosyltransferase family 4 protein [Alcanivorax sp.]|nr:glycosyltransferase family 4 protein [Alcanivorax sp.]
MNIRKVAYMTFNSVPYPSAASLNTLMMVDGIRSIGIDVELYAPIKLWRWSTLFDGERYYPSGYSGKVRIKRVIQIFPKVTRFLAEAIVKKAKADGVSLLYLRNTYFIPAAIKYGIPFILEHHGMPRKEGLRRLPVGHELYKGHVVLTSAAKKEWLSRFPGLEGRIYVEPDAVNLDNFDAEDCGLHDFYSIRNMNRPKIGYFGGFAVGKGAALIPDIARRLPEMDFYMYGGTARDIGRVMDETKDLPANLIIMGRVPHAEAIKAMKKMHALLLPNKMEQVMAAGDDIGLTTSPIKLFEYLACRKVVFASEIPAVTDILENECMVTSSKYDANVWAALIEDTLACPERCIALASNGRALVERYTFKARFSRIFSIAG